jgi:farnesyl diphosphate synthase
MTAPLSARQAPRLAAGNFNARLDALAAEIDDLLERLLSGEREAGEIARPPRLLEAMRYATLGGGKRLRPFLLVESAALFGVAREPALLAGAALECVHCYSLVHDDLPAMDDDELRRGQPTTHKAFDEATAILAGDALLTFAFDILARPQVHLDAAVRIALIGELARASGIGGMAGGQMLDLAAEGRFGDKSAKVVRKLGEKEIATLQAMKTGALIGFACRAGAMLGEADQPARAALDRYGSAIGQAYQIADDVLDVEGESNMMGKATGKDAAAGKATLVAALGRDGAAARLRSLVAQAEEALAPFGANASVLQAAAHFIAERRK